MKKMIAKTDEDIAEVISNLSDDEKLERVKRLYDDYEEVLEILGYYDDSISPDDRLALNYVEYDLADMARIAYDMAINNGNFEVAIAMNKR